MDHNLAITHSGIFHTDDVMAAAILRHAFPGIQILRTRNPKTVETHIGKAILFDIGQNYNAESFQFDHHQKDGAGRRSNGCPYATAGLIWKHYGGKVVRNILGADFPDKAVKYAWNYVDANFLCFIDAVDTHACSLDSRLTAYAVTEIKVPTLATIISTFNAIGEEDQDTQFEEAASYAQRFLLRLLLDVANSYKSLTVLRQWVEASNGGPLLVTDGRLPIGVTTSYALRKLPQILFIIAPHGDFWRVRCVPKEKMGIEPRRAFPPHWTSENLAELTNVEGAKFISQTRWFCETLTKEEAIRLGELAIATSDETKNKETIDGIDWI